MNNMNIIINISVHCFYLHAIWLDKSATDKS